MKKIVLGLLIAAALAVLPLSGIAAATPNQAAGEIDKIVFIHYPQGNVPYWSPLKAPAPTDQDPSYRYTGIHWAVPYVEYLINSSGAPTDAVGAVTSSFQTWEDEPKSTMDFEYKGATSTSGSVLDYSNVVSWQDISESYPGAIAVAVVWYYRGSKEIVDVDTVMNSVDPWSVNAGFTGDPDTQTGESSAYDVQDIMTHEAGHWLMLSDLYQWKTQKLTMYGYGATGELQKRTLGTGDKLGIDRIY